MRIADCNCIQTGDGNDLFDERCVRLNSYRNKMQHLIASDLLSIKGHITNVMCLKSIKVS